MSIKNTISISEARKRFFEIANEVQVPGIHYTFTEKGKPKAVLMSAEEFESWQETLNVMREMPDLDKDIAQARKEYERGEYVTLDQLLAEYGYVVADKPNKKYAAKTDSSKKGPKRAK